MKPNYFVVLLSVIISINFISCSKDKKEDPTLNPTPAPSCSDGIQNQGETGIDCGGPCAVCPTSLCAGIGNNEYFPMKVGNEWHYSNPGSGDLKFKITGTETNNNLTYYVLESLIGAPNERYYRIDSNGDIIRWFVGGEYLEIPMNPIVNDSWQFNNGMLKVLNVNSTIDTDSCSYSGVLTLEYSINGNVISHFNYKKGIGLIQEETNSIVNNLKYLQLY